MRRDVSAPEAGPRGARQAVVSACHHNNMAALAPAYQGRDFRLSQPSHFRKRFVESNN